MFFVFQIGCILTQQFPIQLYTAVYYVGMDIIMIIQYLYYKFKHRKQIRKFLYSSCSTLIWYPVISSSVVLSYGCVLNVFLLAQLGLKLDKITDVMHCDIIIIIKQSTVKLPCDEITVN